MATRIPAVAYYRMSSDKQETSINDQRSAVQQYAQVNGYTIVREFVDEGISGWKTKERLAFGQLIEAADSGRFKAVLCWDIDRFSRFDPLETNHYWYLLDRAGVSLATVAQGDLAPSKVPTLVARIQRWAPNEGEHFNVARNEVQARGDHREAARG